MKKSNVKPYLWFIFYLLITTSWLINISYSQSNQETTPISLTFHNYEETSIDASIYYYNGADVYSPQRLDAYNITVECLTPAGEVMGFPIYSGYIAWTLGEQLQKDLHVDGRVTMTVWMSSTDELGVFQGSGYGMGLTDIDDDGNMGRVFELIDAEGNSYVGGLGNVFSTTPTPYTMILDIDNYVFEEGHTIVFGVGVGSNKEGFKVNIFFDSPDRNSGATMEVKDWKDQYEFDASRATKSYPVIIETSSFITDFEFSQTENQISFTVSTGLFPQSVCDCTIPKDLLGGPFTVFVDGEETTDTTIDNGTHSFISFPYAHGVHHVKIMGVYSIDEEFPDILVSPSSLSETLSHNESKTKTVNIENVGSEDLHISDISGSVSWLSITVNPAPITLVPGESTTFEVELYSNNNLEETAIITIVSDDPDENNIEIPITLIRKETITVWSYDALIEGTNYPILIDTNSIILDFHVDSTDAQIRFNVSGTTGTMGVSNITFPKQLVSEGYSMEVYLDEKLYPFILTENATHYFVYFSYIHSQHHVVIHFFDATSPIADAGLDQTVDEDVSVTVDGSGSTDNAGIISYVWTFIDGTPQTLTGVTLTYTFTDPGTYVVTLNVTDAAGNHALDTVTLTVTDVTPPVATAGGDRTVKPNAVVSFNASGSNDNVDIILYEWDFGDGTTGTGKMITHTYTKQGTYTATLTVKDAGGNEDIDICTITVVALFPWRILGAVLIGGAVVTFYFIKLRK